MSNYSLKIADYTIFFKGMSDGLVLRPSASQEDFLTTDADYDLAVNVFRGPVQLPPGATAVFRAPQVEEAGGERVQKSDKFWTVYHKTPRIIIHTICPTDDNCDEAMLIIRPEELSWDLVMDTLTDEVNPMCYPVDGLLLYYLTALKGDIFIHGSGVLHKDMGYLFTGRSGKGKTTMAGIFHEAGSKVVHDDRLILRQTDGGIFMYNTPVYNNERSKKSLLSSIYIIEHGNSNEVMALRQPEAMTAVMANCIQHHWNISLIEKLTGAIHRLVMMVNTKNLKFVPDSTVIKYIESDGS